MTRTSFNHSFIRLILSAVLLISLAKTVPAQIVGLAPSKDTLMLVTGGDIPPALKYSIDSSTVAIDSVKIFGYGEMFAHSPGPVKSIPYCVFIVRDSSGLNVYHPSFWIDPPLIPAKTEILPEQFTPVLSGPGRLSLVVTRADTVFDSLSVRFIVDFVSDVESPPHASNDLTSLQLMPIYPNPFNEQSTIRYVLPHSGWVSLCLYSSLGQFLHSIVQEEQSLGTHIIPFDGGDLPSGIYFLRLISSGYSRTNKLILLR